MSQLTPLWQGFLQDWQTATQTIKAHHWELTHKSMENPFLPEKLSCFYTHLLDVNTHTNLTRLTGPRDFLYNQVWDAALLCTFIPPESRVADIGCGGGFPLIPTALIRPDIQITGIEATGKKCQFIQSMINLPELDMKDRVDIIHDRAERVGHQPECRGGFDIVTAKALAGLPLLLELSIPLCKTGGQLVALKGPKAQEELDSAKKAIQLLHVKLKRKISVDIPAHQLRVTVSEDEPAEKKVARKTIILLLEKMADTPKTFPRESPAKKPL